MRSDVTNKQIESGAPYRTAPPMSRRRPAWSEREERWPPGSRTLALLLVALLLWTAAIAWREHRLKTEILALPQPTRAALYGDTVDQLRGVCSAQPVLREHCIHEAELVVKFPECDADCRALAAIFLERARR